MKSHFHPHFLENATETLRAIAHPIRLAIIDLLHAHESLTVTEIYQQLEIEQAIASHHLRILKNKNVVRVERDGKNSNYALVNQEYYNVLRILTKTL